MVSKIITINFGARYIKKNDFIKNLGSMVFGNRKAFFSFDMPRKTWLSAI